MHKQLLRNAILLQLEAALPATLPIETLQQGLHIAGHPISQNHLIKELTYLKEKHFVKTNTPALAHNETRYSLSAAGQDYLEAQGLV